LKLKAAGVHGKGGEPCAKRNAALRYQHLLFPAHPLDNAMNGLVLRPTHDPALTGTKTMTTATERFDYPADYPALVRRAKQARAEALTAIFKALARPFMRMKMRRELNALDDRMLADIGIQRADIPALVDRAYQAGGESKAPLLDIEPKNFRWEVTAVTADATANDSENLAA